MCAFPLSLSCFAIVLRMWPPLPARSMLVTSRLVTVFWIPPIMVAIGGLSTCGLLPDPLHDAEVAVLGPEDPAVPQGPLHRPGQPCAVCHGPYDDDAPSFPMAGTVYRDPVEKIPVADVVVAFVDSAGKTFTTTTNCAGNFYVKANEFSPKPPTWVSVQTTAMPFPFKMESPIHREASCAKCHFDPEGPSSAGHIFVADDPTTFASIALRACLPADGVVR